MRSDSRGDADCNGPIVGEMHIVMTLILTEYQVGRP